MDQDKPPLKILYLNSSRSWGRNERWIQVTSKLLAPKYQLFLAYQKGDLGRRIDIPGIRLPFLTQFDLYTLIRLVRYIQKKKIDVIIPTRDTDYRVAALVWRYSKVKTILKISAPHGDRKKYFKQRIFSVRNNAIIVNSEKEKNKLLTFHPKSESKTHVIYNAIEPQEIERLSQMKMGETRMFPFQVVFAGELSSRMNLFLLVKAISIINEDKNYKNKIGLVLIGSGSQSTNLKLYVRDNELEEHIRFVDYQPNPFPFLKESDLFVIPAKRSGISNAALEAMFLKTPVIAVENSGMQEILEKVECGAMIPSNKPEVLAQKILDLYNDKQSRDRFAENGLKFIQTEFSPEAMQTKLFDIFDSIKK